MITCSHALDEHLEHTSVNDDTRERYHRELQDLKINDLMEQHYHDECSNAERLGLLNHDAHGQPDLTEYYDYWRRMDRYYDQQVTTT